MSINVVFVHKGDATYLKYAVAQARSSGYRVYVIGDQIACDAMRSSGLCDNCFLIEDYSDRANAFERGYTHLSVNGLDYELFCYKRWYILAEFVKRQGLSLLYLDSDVLLYDGLDEAAVLDAVRGPGFCNTAWFNYLRGRESIEAFLAYMDKLFADPSPEGELGQMALKYNHEGRPHVSDMLVLREFFYHAPQLCSDTWSWGVAAGIDGNINGREDCEMHHEIKRVSFAGRIPYVHPTIGGEKRVYSLHFQGHAKPLMQVMNTITSEFSGALDDLSGKMAHLEAEHPVQNKGKADLFRELYAGVKCPA
jgi:hypothetical protein